MSAEHTTNPRNVKRCHRCGKMFEDRQLPKVTASVSSEAYIDHRYCPSCSWTMKRAAHACDPRYAGVGGHGGLEIGAGITKWRY